MAPSISLLRQATSAFQSSHRNTTFYMVKAVLFQTVYFHTLRHVSYNVDLSSKSGCFSQNAVKCNINVNSCIVSQTLTA